jgi:hypothetical protein
MNSVDRLYVVFVILVFTLLSQRFANAQSLAQASNPVADARPSLLEGLQPAQRKKDCGEGDLTITECKNFYWLSPAASRPKRSSANCAFFHF